MAFVLPTFNLTVRVWHSPNYPPVAHAADYPCQLRGPSQTSSTTNPTNGLFAGCYFLFPPLTDVRDQDAAGSFNSMDYLECPPGSGRRYYILNVDDIAKGFTNEHRFAIVAKLVLPGSPWPVPIT